MTSWRGLTRVAVYICTTDGPVRIERISNEPAALSEVFIGRGVTAVMPMSDEYEEFVRDHRPVAKAFGPFVHKAFRLDIDRPIQSGTSWHLGVFIAHGLAREKRLAHPQQDPDLVLFLTGSVDADFHVGPVGHLPEKHDALQPLRTRYEEQGIPVACFAPAGDESLDNSLTFAPLASAMDLMAKLTRETVPGAAMKTLRLPGRGTMTGLVAGMLSLGLVALGASLLSGDYDQERTDTPIRIAEKRAPTGSTCASVQFGHETPVLTDIPLIEGGIARSSLDGLCGLTISVTGVGTTTLLLTLETGRFVGLDAIDGGRAGPLERHFTGGGRLELDIPRRLVDGLAYQIDVKSPAGEAVFFHRISP